MLSSTRNFQQKHLRVVVQMKASNKILFNTKMPIYLHFIQLHCALSCAPPRYGLLGYCRRFVQFDVRKCESTFNAIVEVFYCFTIAIDLPGDASCIRLQ